MTRMGYGTHLVKSCEPDHRQPMPSIFSPPCKIDIRATYNKFFSIEFCYVGQLKHKTATKYLQLQVIHVSAQKMYVTIVKYVLFHLTIR